MKSLLNKTINVDIQGITLDYSKPYRNKNISELHRDVDRFNTIAELITVTNNALSLVKTPLTNSQLRETIIDVVNEYTIQTNAFIQQREELDWNLIYKLCVSKSVILSHIHDDMRLSTLYNDLNDDGMFPIYNQCIGKNSKVKENYKFIGARLDTNGLEPFAHEFIHNDKQLVFGNGLSNVFINFKLFHDDLHISYEISKKDKATDNSDCLNLIRNLESLRLNFCKDNFSFLYSLLHLLTTECY